MHELLRSLYYTNEISHATLALYIDRSRASFPRRQLAPSRRIVILGQGRGRGGECFADSAKGGVAAEEVVVEWSETNDNAEDIVLKSGAT